MSDTQKRVIESIASIIGRRDEADQIKPEQTLDEIGADSLDIVEIVMDLEEDFDVEIDDSAADKWQTVQDVVNTVVGLTEKTAA